MQVTLYITHVHSTGSLSDPGDDLISAHKSDYLVTTQSNFPIVTGWLSGANTDSYYLLTNVTCMGKNVTMKPFISQCRNAHRKVRVHLKFTCMGTVYHS